MQRSNDHIVIATDGKSTLPIVVGKCPSCNSGDNSMVLIDFVPNGYRPEHSTIYFKCMCCMSITQKKVCEVSEDN